MLGLKWEAIDFDNKTITIMRTVAQCVLNGKYTVVKKETTKNKASMRTFPLDDEFEECFKEMKQAQLENKKLYGKSYSKEFVGYVFVNELGQLINPDYISKHFRAIIEKNNLKPIRFHDLRHTCASLLLANNVALKDIQEYLGHAHFSTTADIYGHIDYKSKITSAKTMKNIGLKLN